MHVVVMGPISRGDLLVTSGGATGLARALRSGEARPTGAIVGKASLAAHRSRFGNGDALDHAYVTPDRQLRWFRLPERPLARLKTRCPTEFADNHVSCTAFKIVLQ